MGLAKAKHQWQEERGTLNKGRLWPINSNFLNQLENLLIDFSDLHHLHIDLHACGFKICSPRIITTILPLDMGDLLQSCNIFCAIAVGFCGLPPVQYSTSYEDMNVCTQRTGMKMCLGPTAWNWILLHRQALYAIRYWHPLSYQILCAWLTSVSHSLLETFRARDRVAYMLPQHVSGKPRTRLQCLIMEGYISIRSWSAV